MGELRFPAGQQASDEPADAPRPQDADEVEAQIETSLDFPVAEPSSTAPGEIRQIFNDGDGNE